MDEEWELMYERWDKVKLRSAHNRSDTGELDHAAQRTEQVNNIMKWKGLLSQHDQRQVEKSYTLETGLQISCMYTLNNVIM